MSAYDASFGSGLPADLFRGAGTGAALRAAEQLPLHIRMMGMRLAMFTAAAHFAGDDASRSAALNGLRNALRGYDGIIALLADPGRHPDLHPLVADLVAALGRQGRDAIETFETYRTQVIRMQAMLEAEGALAEGAFDALMAHAYGALHPASVAMTERIAQSGGEVRARLERDARAARERAVASRARIEEIARTVRLISLNARVEAARAGEAGRAFGVIAQEIKALSEQTEAASVEIDESLDQIMAQVGVG